MMSRLFLCVFALQPLSTLQCMTQTPSAPYDLIIFNNTGHVIDIKPSFFDNAPVAKDSSSRVKHEIPYQQMLLLSSQKLQYIYCYEIQYTNGTRHDSVGKYELYGASLIREATLLGSTTLAICINPTTRFGYVVGFDKPAITTPRM